MAVYKVTDKATGAEVYQYSAPGPIEWSGMEFATHDHIEEIQQEVAATVVYGGRRSLQKLEFRRLFPAVKRPFVDEFNATFETHPYLTDDQKRAIRSGLEDYKAASEVNLDDPDTIAMLDTYMALGIMTAEETEAVKRG